MKKKATPANPEDPCSLAILDGALCRVNRKGRVTARHEPIGTAVMQFCVLDSGNIVALEHPFGFLDGFSNLTCLDQNLRLRWFFAAPAPFELYAELGSDTDTTLNARSVSGAHCKLDVATGRLLSVESVTGNSVDRDNSSMIATEVVPLLG